MTELTRSDARSLASRLHADTERLGAMIEEVMAGDGALPKEAVQVLEAVSTAVEELRAAEEELVVQSEQLEVSQATIDAERERYGSLFEFAPDGYLETDDLGKIVEANWAASALLGVPGRFLHGKLIQSFLPIVRDRVLLRDLMAAVLNHGQAQEATVEMTPRDGESVSVEVRIGRRYDPVAGRPMLLWLVRDRTERMRLEHELRQLQSYVDLLTALSDINRLMDSEGAALDQLLSRLARISCQSTGADVAVVLTDAKGRIRSRAVEGEAAAELCEVQIRLGNPLAEGSDGSEMRVVMADGLSPWPELAEAAEHHGVRAIVSHPITAQGSVVGTLTLYLRSAGPETISLARMLVENASRVITNAELYHITSERASQLATALESRAVIDQAKGILMAVQRCGPDEAFDLLRRASQRENRKLRAVAESIVARVGSAGSPAPPGPGR
ncbi:MAG TPA: ANTAR domain-containing protein [Acidimicrobiales bacterium]|nr:ANTAR domain-containing protein [Acidimicrobiales bacterium]